MLYPTRSTFLIAWLSVSMFAHAQDPPRRPRRVEGPARSRPPENPPRGDITAPPKLVKEEIKPLPPVAIPDNPPPHEGAFFDLPITVEPPDVLVVEVLEALPGRPITGERLVRPDGTISLGFYGDVYVRGLTIEQAKVKVIEHLRKFIPDEVLGLVTDNEGPALEGEIPNPGRNPFDIDERPVPAPGVVPPDETRPEREARPPARPSREGRPGMRRPRRPEPTSAQVPPNGGRRRPPRFLYDPPKPNNPPHVIYEPPMQVPNPDEVIIRAEPRRVRIQETTNIPPADSNRVFVDIASHNSKAYFVQGDVGVPGRLPVTGKETVLDALNYAGGFVPTAEPTDIHLYRPARGGKPAKDYKIDIDAIHKGIATANLQVFPDDRLIIGRNPIVKKTIELDRAASPINSMMNLIMQYAFSARSLGVMNSPPSGGNDALRIKVNGQNMPMNVADPSVMTQAQREALIKEWAEFLWSISAKDGGALLDEKAFKEALMKKLSPSPEPPK